MNTKSLSAIAVALLATASSSQAAVTIYFEQAGSDVRVSAAGTLALNGQASSAANNNVYGINGGTIASIAAGSFKTTNGSAGSTGMDVPFTVGASATFGFSGSTVYFGADDVIGGTSAAPTLLEWNTTDDFFVLSNTDLATIGADALSGTLWTANITGDTIGVQTIPEPSSSVLAGLAGLALLARRKR